VRGRKVIWHARESLAPGDAIHDSMRRLLSGAPITRFRRPPARLAVGLAYSQVQALAGFPAKTEPNVVTSVIGEHAGLFFFRLGDQPAITNAVRHVDGAFWAAAMDAKILDDSIDALRRCGLRRFIAMPSVAAVAALCADGTHLIVDDDDIVVQLTVKRGCVAGVKRLSTPSESHDRQTSNAAFLAALGAAVSPARAEFLWKPASNLGHRHVARGAFVAGAVALVALGVSTAVVAIQQMRRL